MNKFMRQMNKCKNPGDCRVVLAEDDAMLAMVLSSELDSAGIKFCAARDGITALDLIKSHRPQILLLDVSMPGLTGFELIEIIRSDPELEDVRAMNIIVHTSMELSRDDEERLSLDGKMLFISKLEATSDIARLVAMDL